MKIACLGWGSLIWKTENLLIQREWFSDGPLLPIEFERLSKNGRITLVISKKAKPVRTLWALMATEDLLIAKKSLQEREEIPEKMMSTLIGCIKVDEDTNDNIEFIIKNWAIRMNLDAVIWTKLPPKFNDTKGQVPSIDQVISYLNRVDINTRETAEEYIRKTPKQIDTDYRRIIEKVFGWTFLNQ